MTVAALYVDPAGVYSTLPDVEPWGLPDRDARDYAGPWPVVAHPPCARWCRLAGMVEARYPHLRRGEDGGTFSAALASVRRWGGILEHPAYTDAWAAHDLTAPRRGGWYRDLRGEWTCHVTQSHWGHRARKGTWLLAVGVPADRLPSWPWEERRGVAWVTWADHASGRERLRRAETSATPKAFATDLITLAAAIQSCKGLAK